MADMLRFSMLLKKACPKRIKVLNMPRSCGKGVINSSAVIGSPEKYR